MVVDPDVNVTASGGAILQMPCLAWAVVGRSQSRRSEAVEGAVSRGQLGAAAVCWTNRSRHCHSWVNRKERQSRAGSLAEEERSVWD